MESRCHGNKHCERLTLSFSAANMGRVCVCEICNCGRHRCPRPPTAIYGKGSQGCAVTEYTEKYPGYKDCHPPKSLKPKQQPKGSHERMEGTTTFRSDFTPYEVSRRPGKQMAEYQPKPGEIDLATTYKLEFNPYKVEPRVLPRRPKERIHAAKGKLDTVPTYKEHFRQWEISNGACSKLQKPKASLHLSAEKFGNTTTFQDEFIPRGLVPRESFKPLNATKLSDAPFDGVTSNQLDYIPHPVDVHFVKAPHEYNPSDEPFQDLTTHQHYYQGLPGQMPKSYKPEHIAMSYDAPFQTSTEFRDQFQQWALAPKWLQKTSEYLTPTEEMDLTTTTGTTFIKHHIQPFSSAKPLSKPVCSSAPFEGSTTTKEDFKAWKAQRQEMIHKPQEIQKASGKMEDTTTFKAHYIQHQLQPTVSCKPLTAPLQSEAPMNEDTTYRTEFTPREISVCPASFELIPGFVFKKTDESGHRLFCKLSSKE